MEDVKVPEEVYNKKRRVYLTEYVDSLELEQISDIIVKKEIGQEAVQPGALPETTPQPVLQAFYYAGLSKFTEVVQEEKKWWKVINAKYDIAGDTYLDTETGVFYILVDN